MASRVSEPSELPPGPGRSRTAGIIIVGDEILKVCLNGRGEECGILLWTLFPVKGGKPEWEFPFLPKSGPGVSPNKLEEK